MHFTRTATYALAAGCLAMVTALPLSTAEYLDISATALAPRQELDFPIASSPTSYSYTDVPTASSISYSYTNMPTATPPTQAYKTNASHAPAEGFGSVAVLVICVVFGVIVVAGMIWVVFAHRVRAYFGGCSGEKRAGSPRGGAGDADIPLAGAGRHFDCRPVSMQPEPQPRPFPVVEPQRPQAVHGQTRRQSEPEWVAVFKNGR